MINEIICSYCLCLATAMQSGGNCHKCNEVTSVQLKEIVSQLKDGDEFIAASCYEKGTKPKIDFMSKQGSIFGVGKK